MAKTPYGTITGNSNSSGGANAADTAIQFALQQVGKPYQWGATGPDSFDCSGLAMAAYEHANIDITRTTYTQVHVGQPVVPNAASLRPGDLVFPDPGHVQIYLGGGNVVEAPHTGANVRVVPLRGIWAARRVTTPGQIVSADLTGANPTIAQQAGVFDWASSIGNVFDKITDPWFWVRVGEIVGGFALIIIGILGFKQVQEMIKGIGKTATEAAVVAA